jgi:hypothetical protein
MTVLAAGGLTLSTLWKLVVSALGAGLGVTAAFSSLIYCADRAIEWRRGERSTAAWLATIAGAVAFCCCVALIAYGLVLVASKPK